MIKLAVNGSAQLNDVLNRGLRALAADTPLRLRVQGGSMRPLLEDDDEVEVAPRRFYWPGDLIAFRAPSGALCVHRLVGYLPGGWRLWRPRPVTAAEVDRHWDPPIRLEEVIGRVVTVVGRTSPLSVSLRDRRRLFCAFLRRVAVKIVRRARRFATAQWSSS